MADQPLTPNPPKPGPQGPSTPKPKSAGWPVAPPKGEYPAMGGHTRPKEKPVPPGKPGPRPPDDGIPDILEWKLDWLIWELDQIRKRLQGCLWVVIPILIIGLLAIPCVLIFQGPIVALPFLRTPTKVAPSTAAPPAGSAGCEDASLGPSVRYGGLDLNPMLGSVPAGGSATVTLHTNSNPVSISVDPGGTGPLNVFEICVKTNPPAANTHLGSHVTSKILNPVGDQAWTQIFGTLFVTPLQDNVSDAAGIVKVDVSASQLNAALQNAPTNSGTAQIQLQLGQTFTLELTMVKP